MSYIQLKLRSSWPRWTSGHATPGGLGLELGLELKLELGLEGRVEKRTGLVDPKLLPVLWAVGVAYQACL